MMLETPAQGPPPSASSSSSSSPSQFQKSEIEMSRPVKAVVEHDTDTDTNAINRNEASSSSTAYHPSFLFCGSCTSCGDSAMPPPPSSFMMQKKKKKKKQNSKMVFIHDFVEDPNDIIVQREQEDDEYDGDKVPVGDEKQAHNKNNMVTSKVSFENILNESQYNLVNQVLEGMEHIVSFQFYHENNYHTNAIKSMMMMDEEEGIIHDYDDNHNNNSNNNNTFNVVDIQYNPTIVSMHKILESLNDLGLKNSILHTIATSTTTISATKHNNNKYNGTPNRSTTSATGTQITSTDKTTSTSSLSTKCRSSFYVDGICCASEVPIVTSIIKSIPSKKQYISKVSINITNRMVYVEYHPDYVTAHDIHNALQQEGFEKSTIGQDGNLLYNKRRRKKEKQDEDKKRKEKQIESTSQESEGYVETKANNNKYNEKAENVQDGAMETRNHTNNALATFVESVLHMPSLSEDVIEIMQEIFFANEFLHDYIRSYSPNTASNTIKIEHNPKLISIQNILGTIMEDESSIGYFDECTILVDGFQEGLVLPPPTPQNDEHRNEHVTFGEQEDYISAATGPSLFVKRRCHCFRACGIGTPHGLSLNIILSGIFWILSVIGHFTEIIYLQYLGLFSVLFGLPPVAKKALRTLRRKQFDANCMMVTAALGAVALQQFDEAASVSFLFAISEYLEDKATQKAKKALDDIIKMRPDHANYIDPDTGEIKIVSINDLDIDDLVSVRMGDKIPSDGLVVEGLSQIDESSLTGESRPINKSVGDTVSGGTINVGSTRLVIKTTVLVEDSAVSRLIRLVEESASSRSPTEKIVDSFARSYTPAVICVALLLCTIPWFWGVDIGRQWTLNGLIIIVIACPCALTISTPVTYAAGLAATAQQGIIVKGGARLEALGSVKRIIFDKTGTLTEGKFRLVDLKLVGNKRTRREVLQLLAAMEGPSSHPLAATLVNAAKDEGINNSNNISVSDHSILKGEGVTAKVNGQETYVGNVRLFRRLGMFDDLHEDERITATKWNNEGSTVGFIGVVGVGITGMFCAADVVRYEAKEVVQTLMRDGIDVFMLTGDGAGPAAAVAREVGIPNDRVQSQFLPEDKLHYVASMLRSSKLGNVFTQQELLLMCGDGVNDAPALAVADIGVAMGEGSALALEISDVTLMDSNLSKLLFGIKTGMKVIATVQENIAVSISAKIIVIVLTFMGKMTLLGAIASDVGIMLLVSINGMKLLPGGTGLLCCKRRRAKYSKIKLQRPTNDLV